MMSDTDICLATSQRKWTRLTRVHVECLCLDKDKMARKGHSGRTKSES